MESELESLEAEILSVIVKLNNAKAEEGQLAVMSKLFMCEISKNKQASLDGFVPPRLPSVNRYRARLRNLVLAYRQKRSPCQIDDLLFAIIRDDALSLDDIQVVFDYTDQDLADAIKRMNERR
tara:strand:+ start:3130 stop:3498 length:369 start_codon:yes stop_codon:yes gene_type:complete